MATAHAAIEKAEEHLDTARTANNEQDTTFYQATIASLRAESVSFAAADAKLEELIAVEISNGAIPSDTIPPISVLVDAPGPAPPQSGSHSTGHISRRHS